MAKIKGWDKVYDEWGELTYANKRGGVIRIIDSETIDDYDFYDYAGRFPKPGEKGMGGRWVVVSSIIGFQASGFPTKAKAMEYALNWMKKHPRTYQPRRSF